MVSVKRMVKTAIAAVVLLTLTGCGVNVKKEAFLIAEDLCNSNEGLMQVRVDPVSDVIEASCNNGARFLFNSKRHVFGKESS